MPRGKARMNVDERRSQLLELGIRLFSERAYDELSTDEIATLAGVSKGLLYHYFDNKRGFYVASIREVARRLEAVTEPRADEPLTVALAHALRRFLAFVADNAGTYRALMRGGIGADVEAQAIIEGVRQTIVGRVLDRAGVREPSTRLRTAIYGWVGFVEFVSLDWVDRGRVQPRDEVFALMLEAFAVVSRALAPEARTDKV